MATITEIERAKSVAAKVESRLSGTPTRYTPPACWDETGCPDDCAGCHHGFHEKRLPRPCSHAAGFHEPQAPSLHENAHRLGLRVTRGGAYIFPKAHILGPSLKIPPRTAENIAACAALGLSYWSDHPRPAMVWAVDDQQRAHSVHIDRKAAKVEHRCWKWTENIGDYSCPETSRVEKWTRPTSNEDVFEILAARPSAEVIA